MRATWRYRFPVSRERLWPFVSDTDRINRAAGLPPVTYRFEQHADGPRTIATVRRGPLHISWYEPPFTWEVPKRLTISRCFIGSPFAVFASDVRLTDDEAGGTILDHHVELSPRNLIGTLLAPLAFAFGRRGAERAYAAAAQAALEVGADAVLTKAQRREEDALEARFIGALGREPALRGRLDDYRDVARALATFVETADDRELARIRPYALADRLQLDRRRVLAAMLGLTRGSLFDLSWDVVCGGCRRPQRFDELAALESAVHCPMCNVTYGPEFDRNVEVTFSAAPLGRGADVPVFCALGPHENRQVFAQARLEAGELASLDVTLAGGRYALQLPPRVAAFRVEADAGTDALAVRVDAQAIAFEPAAVRAGPVHVRVENASSEPLVVKVVEAELPADIATAADVTALQEFRDLFSSEVLASGLELSIRSLAIVFSDLVGSTHLYSTTGDAPAFRIVQQHFDALRELVREHRGAIVKTIGDAVMAVFVDPGDALAAALRFGSAVGIVEGPRGPLEIRVGMHAGPCIAMRANDRLDYFGTTVNLAARIGHVARAGEVALSGVTAEVPAVARLIAGRRQRVEQIAFKGIGAPVTVVRLDADRA